MSGKSPFSRPANKFIHPALTHEPAAGEIIGYLLLVIIVLKEVELMPGTQVRQLNFAGLGAYIFLQICSSCILMTESPARYVHT